MCARRLHWDHIYPWKQLVQSYDVPIESYGLIRQLTVILGFHTHLEGGIHRNLPLRAKKRVLVRSTSAFEVRENIFSDYYHPTCVFADFIGIISNCENNLWDHTMSQSKAMTSYVSWQWFSGIHAPSAVFSIYWENSENHRFLEYIWTLRCYKKFSRSPNDTH